ncbi:MAG TPA: cbb3-type cytochrome c oxidase subunit II [Eoetvoesiella sp.]|uniref:cbb3-type cytochrome c oxidase subunit II n=1 Tax=Eoetvoesiella sp. TaxID=1966355 RepID=UPI002C9687BB|nr:cbb3-type cytochrome c oxidase subunit II [Eoetvoesiella sp.]HWK60647.1 cbb3-type cytochrome c oxidase subunit II [Eoetvoesiella sp.]
MENETKLLAGGMVTLSLATAALVVLPFLQLKNVPPPEGLKPYTSQQLRGRQVYMSNGCIACHTQQPSSTGAGVADSARGWGRPSVAGDYYYDQPVLLGTSRTGPDLFNIGARQPSADWQLGHLFQPRAYVPGSIMPAFPFLFEIKKPGDVSKDERVVSLPPGTAPEGRVVVARPEAMDLVAYLLSLNHTYDALTPEQLKYAESRLPPERLKQDKKLEQGGQPAANTKQGESDEKGKADGAKANP